VGAPENSEPLIIRGGTGIKISRTKNAYASVYPCSVILGRGENMIQKVCVKAKMKGKRIKRKNGKIKLRGHGVVRKGVNQCGGTETLVQGVRTWDGQVHSSATGSGLSPDRGGRGSSGRYL